MDEVLNLVKYLLCNDNKVACNAMKALEITSDKDNSVYKYFDQFVEMLNSENSYMRNRACILISANAKWDTDNKIDEIIDDYLKLIEDPKPITSRQCLKGLINIAKYKADLQDCIKQALQKADVSKYKDSMQPLICKDIKKVLEIVK